MLQAAAPSVAKRRLAAEVALEFIGRLYRIEKEARVKELSVQDIYELRQQQARPVLEEFKHWLCQRRRQNA